MSTTLDEPALQPSTSPSQRLRTSFAAVRIAFTWLGTRKTLSTEQKAQAAETFGAEGEFLSAGKKLLDTKHPAFKAVTGVRSRIVSLWKGMSLPYPEPGIRLIRQDRIDTFTEQLTNLKVELDESVWRLDEHYAELKSAARGKPKVFRDSAIENLTAFFERFRELNIRSNEQLDDLVGQCQQVVSGVEPQTLRDNQVLRTSVASELSQVQNVLDDLLVDRPRRNILRRPR